MSPDEAGWQPHRAVLDAHRPFRNFEFSRLGSRRQRATFALISGDPVFDAIRCVHGLPRRRQRRHRAQAWRRRRYGVLAPRWTPLRMRYIWSIAPACVSSISTTPPAACGSKHARRCLRWAQRACFRLPRAELERIYDEIIAGGGGAEPLEMLRTRADGSQVWVELRRHAQRSGAKAGRLSPWCATSPSAKKTRKHSSCFEH